MKDLLDTGSYVISGVTLLGGFLLFYNQTDLFWGSLGAAIIASGVVWIGYVITRWIILALFYK